MQKKIKNQSSYLTFIIRFASLLHCFERYFHKHPPWVIQICAQIHNCSKSPGILMNNQILSFSQLKALLNSMIWSYHISPFSSRKNVQDHRFGNSGAFFVMSCFLRKLQGGIKLCISCGVSLGTGSYGAWGASLIHFWLGRILGT